MANWVRSASNRRTAKAIGFELAQHARNRLALALVLFFIPSWIALVEALLPEQPIAYQSNVVGGALTVPSNQLATISGALNAVTLIVGFMMFAAVRRSGDFDQRLVLAGYARSSLLLAKSAALVLTSVMVALYASVLMTLFWDPRQVWSLALGLLVGALTYGGMGIVLGLVLPTELAGMFMIIMISLVDVIVQNPVINPASNQDVVRFMPTYGAMQTAAAAGFTDEVSAVHALVGLVWLAGFGSVSVTAFYVRTKDHAKHDPLPDTPASIPAVVTVTTRSDGSLEVRAVSGPILLCSHAGGCLAEHAAKGVAAQRRRPWGWTAVPGSRQDEGTAFDSRAERPTGVRWPLRATRAPATGVSEHGYALGSSGDRDASGGAGGARPVRGMDQRG